MSTRIVPNLPFKDYLASSSYSSTELRLMLDAPKLLYAKRNGAKEDPNQEHFIQGRALHSDVLEHKQDWIVSPETYPDSKGKQSPWTYKANYCCAWRDRQTKDVLTPKQHNEVLAWSKAIREDEQASRFLNVEGRSELSIFATDPETGLPLRIRIDWCPANGSALFDVKTSLVADPRGFTQKIGSLLYHVQAALYLQVYNMAAAEHGLQPKTEWVFIAVQKSEPYICKCYRLSAVDISLGAQLVRKALNRIKACEQDPRKWKLAYPGQTSGEVMTLNLPDYVLRNTNAQDDAWQQEGWQ